MTNSDQLKDDLQYVRNAVERQKTEIMPQSVALLWSGYVVLGFTMLDLVPATGGIFLFVGALFCYFISLRLGAISARAAGVRDRVSARLHLLHWGTALPASGVLLLIATENALPGKVLGQILLVMTGILYSLAGVHFRNRPLVGVGLAMMGFAAVLTYLERWGWTGAGIAIAIGILLSGSRRPVND